MLVPPLGGLTDLAARARAGNSHTAGLPSPTIDRNAATSPINVFPALVGATTITCPGLDSTTGTAFDCNGLSRS